MRQGLPLYCAQERRAGFVVEGDDDAGGRQVRGVGHGRTTEKRAESTEGSCGTSWGHPGLRLLSVQSAAAEAGRRPYSPKPMPTPLRLPSLESPEEQHRLGELPRPRGSSPQS